MKEFFGTSTLPTASPGRKEPPEWLWGPAWSEAAKVRPAITCTSALRSRWLLEAPVTTAPPSLPDHQPCVASCLFALQGQTVTTAKEEPTPAAQQFQRYGRYWLMAAGTALVAYALGSGRYVRVQGLVQTLMDDDDDDDEGDEGDE